MKVSAEDIGQATEHLAFSEFALSGGYYAQAGRAAYMAAFHAAQGYILALEGIWST